MKKRMFVIFLAMFLAIQSTGCWNYREIEDVIIVSGLAIDKGEKGGFSVTFELVDIQAGGPEAQISTKLVTSEGATVFDAIRNSIQVAGSKMYFPHAKVVIVSKEIAKEGIIPAVDFLYTDAEPRYDLDLLISKEKTAKEILEQKSLKADILSFGLRDLLQAEAALSKAPFVELWHFMQELSTDGTSPIATAIAVTTNEGESTPIVNGTALFKRDKFVGFLNGEDTKTLLFIRDEVEGGILVVEFDSTPISLEIFDSQTKVIPTYSEGRLIMDIQVNLEVALAEIAGTVNVIEEANMDKLQKIAEEMLEERIKKLVEKVQEDYGSDIFGFGSKLRLEKPSLWKESKGDWNEMFEELDINVKAEIKIRNSALTSKPIKVGN